MSVWIPKCFCLLCYSFYVLALCHSPHSSSAKCEFFTHATIKTIQLEQLSLSHPWPVVLYNSVSSSVFCRCVCAHSENPAGGSWGGSSLSRSAHPDQTMSHTALLYMAAEWLVLLQYRGQFFSSMWCACHHVVTNGPVPSSLKSLWFLIVAHTQAYGWLDCPATCFTLFYWSTYGSITLKTLISKRQGRKRVP